MPKAIKAGITKQPSRHNPYDLPNTLRKPQDPEAAETSLYLEEDSVSSFYQNEL